MVQMLNRGNSVRAARQGSAGGRRRPGRGLGQCQGSRQSAGGAAGGK